jgi:hypothetical protein
MVPTHRIARPRKTCLAFKRYSIKNKTDGVKTNPSAFPEAMAASGCALMNVFVI